MANEKHIFIGIGGQGVKTVAQIKAKVYEKRFPEATASKSRLQAMNDSYRFLFIDTDQRDIDNANKENRESFEHGKVPFISPQTDLINLGRANPQAIYYEARREPSTLINKRILEACSPELSNRIPDQPLSFGAGAFRIKSRIAFAHSLADFQSKLQAAISSLNDVKTVGGEDCIIYYWLVSSSLGGTGSGIFNDVLYHINQLHHQIVGNGDPQLVYTLYMPKVFIDANSTEEKYSLNAFGVFTELEAFKKMSYEERQKTVMHRLAFNDDYNLVDGTKRYCPFYYVIPVDIQTDKGTSLGSPSTMCHNTAEMLYHLHNGQAGATFRSDIDNYMNDIMEQNHEEFLVPMGYVSLQKPLEQFAKYMRARFRRDVLRSWLLCNDKRQAKVAKEELAPLYRQLFVELDPQASDSVAADLAEVGKSVKNTIDSIDTESEKMEAGEFAEIKSDLNKLATQFKEESRDERKAHYKKLIVGQLWKQAEQLIRERGLAYTYNALIAVHKLMFDEYNLEEQDPNKSLSARENALKQQEEELQRLSDDAAKIDLTEKITKTNHKQIQAYVDALNPYVQNFINLQVAKWAHEIKRDFCMDEKNDEISKLARHISSMITKAEELNREAVKYYKRLATDFGETAMDVTTVYLPMLKTICDGNGWKHGNFFSKLYTKVITAEDDEEETPVRPDLMKFLDQNIYLSSDDDLVEPMYKVALENKETDRNSDEPQKSIDTRYFANPVLVDRGNVSAEKVIEDFLTTATIILENKLHNNEFIQEQWDNRKISTFFADLTNQEKDEVRRSLNPALFFSYNNNRIDVTKKEEHVIFVAGSEDLAAEMLGYQKGNTKHRFEKSGDENTALVLKSKFGLALKDYRIYDSIKRVYDRATFREKYHFHHDFAQYLDKLTLDNLPYEVLPQHRSFVKMLILSELRGQLSPLFFKDEYDIDNTYIDTMYYSDYDKSFKIALPEAFVTDSDITGGKIGLRTEADGRNLFHEIVGKTFADRFDIYMDMYHNARFGETTDRLIQAILRTNIADGENTIKGEKILKDNYSAVSDKLLRELSDKKHRATLPEEKRLYGIFFNILREEYPTVNDFKK
ncbi:MAG: hypothetical protein NC111_04525 [Bacteroides sp.]|nr:hypothetical protein [Bacteroides sp.]MCM1413068.1 hypothetical protein [Bacteroides sp.]MCM1471774.1 hypothetical protein [Bacteroides sp.]